MTVSSEVFGKRLIYSQVRPGPSGAWARRGSMDSSREGSFGKQYYLFPGSAQRFQR